jgi:hypothetical protein
MRRISILALAGTLAIVTAAHASSPAANTPEKAADPKDKVICKRFTRIGSLVDSYRTCKTKAEWDRERENVRQFGVSDSCSSRGEPAAGACNP